MDPLDRLLANLEGKQPEMMPSPSPPAASGSNASPSATGSVDDLLAQLEPNSSHHSHPASSSPAALPPLSPLAALPPLPPPTRSHPAPPRPRLARSHPAPATPPIPPEPIQRSATDPLFAQLKADYAERDRIEAQQREQQQQEAQRRQEQLDRQRRAALAEQAKQWLQQLAPNSDEWLWFEEFSQRYPSKLEAAIDYLDAVYHQSSDDRV